MQTFRLELSLCLWSIEPELLLFIISVFLVFSQVICENQMYFLVLVISYWTVAVILFGLNSSIDLCAGNTHWLNTPLCIPGVKPEDMEL